jgi:hypothetical protein
MNTQRITYTSSFTAKAALAAADQAKTVRQRAARFTVHPVVISRWNAQLLEKSESIFQDGRIKKKSGDPNIGGLYQETG